MGCTCRNHNKWYTYHLHHCVILSECVCVCMYILAGPILHNFALIKLENLHHFSNLCYNFWFNTIWYRQSVAMLIDSRRLAESDFTIKPSVTYMDWLHWWYHHTAHLVSSSTALDFLTRISDKHITTLPNAVQVKNWHKITAIEEKLDVISWLEKGKRIGDIKPYPTLVHSSIVIMLIELNKVLSQELKCLCSKTTTRLLEWNVPKIMFVEAYIFTQLETNKYTVKKCMYTVYTYLLHGAESFLRS